MNLPTRLLPLHRWVGLFGALWLAILGVSGLMLDHRDDWRWAWQFGIPHHLLPDHTVESLATRHITLLQANPDDASQWVAGGAAGAWLSTDGTRWWRPITFEGESGSPMIYAMLVDEVAGWERLWLASDDGLWEFSPTRPFVPAKRAGLQGRRLTALDRGSVANSLIAIEDRSRILRIRLGEPIRADSVELDQIAVEGLPEEVAWSRFLFDTHLGRSFVRRDINLAVNDFGALAFALLALTGVLQWWYRRHSHHGRQVLRNSLFNLHAPLIGLLAIGPVIYLSVTGIIMDHRGEWMPALVGNKIDRDLLPPVYDFPTLRDEISHVVAYSDQPDKFTIGTRLGVLTTEDGGTRWVREQGPSGTPGFVWSLRREGNQLFAGGLGGPSFQRPLESGDWQVVPGLVGMPSDATVSQDRWFVISGPAAFEGDLAAGLKRTEFQLPRLDAIPLMLIMFEIHNGNIVSRNARYFLDLLALLAIFMVVTGPILWWRKKWAKIEREKTQ